MPAKTQEPHIKVISKTVDPASMLILIVAIDSAVSLLPESPVTEEDHESLIIITYHIYEKLK